MKRHFGIQNAARISSVVRTAVQTCKLKYAAYNYENNCEAEHKDLVVKTVTKNLSLSLDFNVLVAEQTSDEVSNLVVGQRVVVAASGGNFSDMTQSLKDEREGFAFMKQQQDAKCMAGCGSGESYN